MRLLQTSGSPIIRANGRIDIGWSERSSDEAAYFGTENGRRTGYIVFDMVDSAQIPVIAEPLFQRAESKVEFIPVMNADDLQRGLAQAAGGWG